MDVSLTKADKEALLGQLLEALKEERDTLVAAQRSTAEGVTHADSRQEGDKDMRATEASYVARGQAQRVEALQEDIARVASLRRAARVYGSDDAIALGAVVHLEPVAGGTPMIVLVAPAGGGVRLRWKPFGKFPLHVVTTASPLGRALVGKTVGDDVVVKAGRTQELEIVGVQ